MKVHEILNEQRLDEAIPFLALPAIMAAISAFFAGLTAIDVYNFVKKYNEDPNAITDDQWGDILIDVALAAIPGAARLGKAAIVKFLPDSVKQKGAEWIKGQITSKLAKQKDALKDKYGVDARKGMSPEEQKAARHALAAKTKKATEASQAAKLKAANTIKKIPDKMLNAFSSGIAVKFAYEYWEKIHELEIQYDACVNKKDTTTALFGPATPQEAYQTAQRLRQQYLGEFVAAVGAAIAVIPSAAATSMLGKLFGKAGSATGIPLVGGAMALPFKLASSLTAAAGPGLLLFLQTESGKKFLENEYVQLVTKITGTVSAAGIDLLWKAVEELGKVAGVNTAAVTGAMKSKITPPGSAAPAPTVAGGANDTSIPISLRKEVDPKNPKIMYIGGVQITDDKGFQLVDDEYLNKLRSTFRGSKIPDPTLSIPKAPNA
jgi:hypothetical protein